MGRTFYTLCPRELLWPSIYFRVEVAKSPDIEFLLFLFVKSFKHNSKSLLLFFKNHKLWLLVQDSNLRPPDYGDECKS